MQNLWLCIQTPRVPSGQGTKGEIHLSLCSKDKSLMPLKKIYGIQYSWQGLHFWTAMIKDMSRLLHNMFVHLLFMPLVRSCWVLKSILLSCLCGICSPGAPGGPACNTTVSVHPLPVRDEAVPGVCPEPGRSEAVRGVQRGAEAVPVCKW